MIIKQGETYIERPKYFFKTRVAVVSSVTDTHVGFCYLHFDSLKASPSSMPLDKFKKRFEKCWLKMRYNNKRR